MTKEQIASWMSQTPLFTTLCVIAVGLLLGLLLAWLFWRRRYRDWKDALLQKKELDSETAEYESRNRYLQNVIADKQKNAAGMDWGKFDFVSPGLAVKLTEFGIKDLAHLQSLSASQRAKLDSRFAVNGLSLNWEAVDRAHGSLSPAQDADVDWSKVEGADAQTAAELKRMGIKSIGELEDMSPAERVKFEAELTRNGISWDWGKLAGWKTALGLQSYSNGADSNRTSSPDFQVTGFASATGGKSNSIPEASPQDAAREVVTAGAASSSSEGSGNDGSGNEGSGNDGSGLGDTGSAGSINVEEVVARDLQNTEPPRLFESIPQWKDDLTLLDGIDDPQSRELRKMGIYNFEQLHNLPHLEQARLQAWFNKKGWQLDMDQWRISSEGNTLNPSIESIQHKAYEVYCHRSDHQLWGDESTDWDQAEWALRGNPIWGYGVPHDVEDFAQTMEGVTEEARDELYRMGLHNRHQVDLLNEQDRRLLTSWFAGPRFGVDLTKAFGWLSTLKPVPEHLEFGSLCNTEPAQVDDLSRINGISNATESDLNRLGIYHFSQIADWTQENCNAISEALGLEDRIQQDAWMRQAKMFMNREQ